MTGPPPDLARAFDYAQWQIRFAASPAAELLIRQHIGRAAASLVDREAELVVTIEWVHSIGLANLYLTGRGRC